MEEVKKRNVAWCIIFTVITLGIYGIYWYIKISDDLNILCRDDKMSGIKAFLLTFITCGIFGLYWSYKWGERVDNLREERGKTPGSSAIVYLLLSLVGFNIIAMALCQDEINKALDYRIIV